MRDDSGRIAPCKAPQFIAKLEWSFREVEAMIEASAASLPRAFNPSVVVAVCFAIAALEGYDIQALGVAAPAMGAALRLAKDQVGFAGSAAMAGLVIGAVFGGWLADRIGRKPVLVASVAWFGVFSLITALAFDANTLMLARLATGLGFGGAMPNMIAIAVEICSPSRRAATVTTMVVGMPAGGALAAIVTRFAPETFDWRLIFIIGGLAPLAIAPLAHWLLPETRPQQAAGQRRSLAALFGGGRAVGTLLLWTAFALTLILLYLMLSWLPTLVIAKGLPREAGSLAAICFNLAAVAGGLILGLVVDRLGFRWPLAATYLALSAAMAALAIANGVWPIMALASLTGFLVVGSLFSIYALAPFYYPAAARGTGTGAAVGAGRVGSIVGPSVGGLLLAGGASGAQVVQSVIPMAIGAGLAVFLLTILGKPYAE
jgi:AAHS family 3-hydroxyphenylpropionic acid transporter